MPSTTQASTQPASRPTTQPAGAIGRPMVRRDGREKVTGAATYSAEWQVDNLHHGVVVLSTIASGKIKSMTTAAAERAPGVVGVMTHDNAPKVSQPPKYEREHRSSASLERPPLADEQVRHAGQIIAVVVADTLENAERAASLVKVEYEAEDPAAALAYHLREAEPVKKNQEGKPMTKEQGDPESALASAAAKVDQRYHTPREHHNPIEPHATIAQFHPDGSLTVYNATQYVFGDRATFADLFGLKEEQVRVICQYTGGAFGSKGNAWPHTPATAMAAKKFGVPVKIVLERKQMYGTTGYRSPTYQRVAFGADSSGKLTSVIHSGTSMCGINEDYRYVEWFTTGTAHLYVAPNRHQSQGLVKLNAMKPTFMRAPGETPGVFATETALDELAVELKMDPIELRRTIEPQKNAEGKPFSLRRLIDCLDRGAKSFGWAGRNPEPRSMKTPDGWLVGYGVATTIYPHNRFPTTAKLTFSSDGSALVSCGSQEIGGGTKTSQVQFAAQMLGVPVERVKMVYGDTRLPRGNVSGGSSTAASIASCTLQACGMLHEKLLKMHQKQEPKDSPWAKLKVGEVTFADGRMHPTSEPSASISMSGVLENAMRESVEAEASIDPKMGGGEMDTHSFGAQFVEVHVDPDLGTVRIARMHGVFNCGIILSGKTARSQFLGGMVMGVGMALTEETHVDERYGRITNDNLSEYHVPTNADIGPITIDWIDEPDYQANPTGAKGVGEIGIVGVAAAVANAVYHATGKRVRDLPITPDKVM